MTVSDTRLTDAPATAVLAALAGAFRALVEAGAAPIRHTQIALKRAANRTASEPEGLAQWSSAAAQVLVAWWTAVSGRRHVRVLARTLDCYTAHLANETTLGTRPPVWHVFPERVYRRRVGKTNELIAVCGCGAVGTERALGWAGPCCGPCADYRDEHGAPPWVRPALFPTGDLCRAVAGSADGTRALAATRGTVFVWDTAAPGEPLHTSSGAQAQEQPPVCALSPDGRFLARSEPGHGRFRVFDLSATPPRESVQFAPVSAAAFHPGSGALYFVTDGTLLVSDPPTARPTGTPFGAASGGALAFGTNGERVAVYLEPNVQVFGAGGVPLARVPLPASQVFGRRAPPGGAPHVALAPDGARVAVGYAFALAVYHATTGECQFYDGKLDGSVTGLAFDRAGRWLFVSRYDGSLVAYPADTYAPGRTAVFRWSLGPLRGLATCGDAVLTACDEGAKVWPVAELLGGV